MVNVFNEFKIYIVLLEYRRWYSNGENGGEDLLIDRKDSIMWLGLKFCSYL